MASSGENPLANNERLQKLMACVDTLSSEKEFLKWKKSFLKVYTTYLDPDGVLNAKDANYRLLKKLQQLTKRVTKVQELIDNRNIHPEQVTAEGRRGLTNLSDELANAEKAINEFMPKTSSDEEKMGYDKFELGANLIQDAFYGYDLMVQTRDTLEVITKQQLAGIADNTFLRIHQHYALSIDVFIQVMEDLGLFHIMKQCVEVVYKGKPRKEPKPPQSFTDAPDGDDAVRKGLKTTTIKKTTTIRSKGKDRSGGAASDDDDDSVGNGKKKRNGKIATGEGDGRGPNRGTRGSVGDPDGDDPAAEEKKEEEKDEEEGEGGESEFLYYFDPKTNAIGMIDRKMCGAKSKLMVDLEKEGKDAYENHVTNDDERQQLIWLLKKLEKTKPKETSWLEEIKREKAAKSGKPIDDNIKKKSNGRKMPTGSKPAKRRSDASTSSSTRRTDISSDANNGFAGPGFRDPFAGVSSSSNSKNGTKKTVENYQGKYKKAAAKPVSGGWKKMT